METEPDVTDNTICVYVADLLKNEVKLPVVVPDDLVASHGFLFACDAIVFKTWLLTATI